ncbi:MAG: NADH:ubiquinone reductase (Na(+)-transporting) subunit C [Owenweeksia sp.]
MALDVNKNSYTFMFAAIMVVVVAALLSFAATSLKPMQDENVEREKMQNILASIGVEVERDGAEEKYKEYIKQELVIRNGKVEEGVDAFTVEMSKEVAKPAQERNAPLYVASKEGQTYYIIPLRGKGLWGPIWGYISLSEDANTVYGAVFDHKGETPGLGAEIVTPMFSEQFHEKKILNADKELVSIEVRKGDASGEYQVDGISGGTITSQGVQDMIEDNMDAYFPFLLNFNSGSEATAMK